MKIQNNENNYKFNIKPKNEQKQETKTEDKISYNPVNYKHGESLKAYAMPFAGTVVKNDKKLIVSDLLTEQSGETKVPADKDLKTTSYKISCSNKQTKNVVIKDESGNLVAEINAAKDCKLPIDFNAGKFGNVLKIHDPESEMNIIMKHGEIKSDKWQIRMPAKKDHKQINFAGNLYVFTKPGVKETKDTVNNYFSKNLAVDIPKGKFTDEIKTDCNMILTTQGDGTRLKHIINSKAAAPIPSAHRTLVHDPIDKGVAAGIINSKDTEVKLIDDKHLQGNAFIIGKELREGLIPSDKPAILAPCDCVSNIDYTRMIKDYETKQDAGLMLTATAVPEGDTESYGFMKLNDNDELEKYIPKYADSKEADEAKIKSGKYKDQYLAALPLSMMHPAVLKELAQNSITDGEYFMQDFIPSVIKKLNNGEILDEKGNPLKVYVHTAETITGEPASLDDAGTHEGFTKSAKKIAKGEMPGIPEKIQKDYRKNVDLETGTIFLDGTKEQFNKFKAAQGLTLIKGDFIVTNK